MTDLVVRGADIILANGLAHGEYVNLLAGNPPRAADKCPVCPRAALALAAGRDHLLVVEWPMHRDLSLSEGAAGRDAELAHYALIVAAETRLRRYLVEALSFQVPANLPDGEVIERSAGKTHCPQGHPYEGWNLIRKYGRRYCRACIYARRTAARRRSA